MAQAKKALSKNGRKPKARAQSPRASSKTYYNYIAGSWVKSASGETYENLNPADTRDCVGRFPLSTEDDVNLAVDAAREAFDGWRRMPAPRRAEILFRLGEILIRNKERYALDMTREMGKVLKETGGDVQEAIDCTYYTAGDPGRDAGQVRHVRAPARGPVRPDYALEFSHGDSVLEAYPGSGLRQHRRHQARGRHSALDLQLN
jgi:aldehyde dehydrogenase (NAD+)